MRISERRITLGWLVSAALVAALAGCSSRTGTAPAGSAQPGSAPPVASTSGSSTSGPHGSAPAGGTGAGARPPGGPVPAGFLARDFTFVSPDQGWLLGTAPCSSAPCTSIVRTTDGGRSWVGIPAPRADLEFNGQNGCDADQACVRGLRFADTRTGYAYGSTGLYLTRDGGATWSRQPGQADAVEVGDGTALRVGHGTEGCPPGCGYQVSTAPVGGTQWQTVSLPGTLTGNAVQLLRVGHRAFLAVYRNTAGGAEDAHSTLVTSADDGGHWTLHSDPCGSQGGQEADTTQLAAGPDGSLTVLCRVRQTGVGFVATSTDGGASFGPAHRFPDGPVQAVGAASATVLLVSSGGNAYRSTDSGVSWTQVARAPFPSEGEVQPGVFGFQNAGTGRWVPGGAQVLTTTDGGRTWTTATFGGS
ncbi:hypothetical protein GCM10023322_72670 [Rugosimonospora acidiphila]|uniref:Exo-alpha-sialidase n=1 Tax=Rugosimonospora acidiphila TaxID=556531 RepID=A0ABP9SMK5_9ACTN